MPTILSPASTTAVRYDNVATLLFAGRVNINIPLYESKDIDFPINISLQYLSEAFMPNKHSGIVGYNWILNAGGQITREVRGLADELQQRNAIGGGYTETGMLVYTTTHSTDPEKIYLFSEDVYMDIGGIKHIKSTNSMEDIDYMPDIFHFSFSGYSGTFIINNAGHATIIDGDYVDIDVSELPDLHPNYNAILCPKPKTTSAITIKTLDGYTYVFGGSIETIEYTLYFDDNQQMVAQKIPAISTWRLKQITAPNNRKVTFYYKPLQNGLYANTNDPLLVFDQFSNRQTETSTYKVGKSWTKECVLDSIVINGTYPEKIIFHNSVESKTLFHDKVAYPVSYCNYQLDSMSVVCDERLIKAVNLEYDTKSRHVIGSIPNTTQEKSYNWRFLTKVNTKDSSEYSLSYNHPSQYPELTDGNIRTFSESYHGYWGQQDTKGMLSEITYPTGGRQVLTFEKHMYGTMRRYVALSTTTIGLADTLKQENIYGVRIKRIDAYQDNELTERRQFFYLNDDYATSSGIYYNYGNVRIGYTSSNAEVYTNAVNTYDFLETHIGYKRVTETVTTNLGNTFNNVHYFDTGLSEFNSDDEEINIQPNARDESFLIYASGMLSYNRTLHKPGTKLRTDYYDDNYTLRKRVTNTYNKGQSLLPQPASHTVEDIPHIVILSCHGPAITRKVYPNPKHLMQTSTLEYVNGAAISTSANYSYTDKLRIRQITTQSSDGTKTFVKYIYPDNITKSHVLYGTTAALHQLVLANRVNEPIETISGYIDNNTEYVTSGELKLFSPAETATHGKPVRLYKTLSLQSQTPISDFETIDIKSNNLKYDSHYKTACVYDYDRYIRAISVKPIGEPNTFIQWDDIYPTQVTSNNQTTTYTYIPSVGISSITDYRGLTTYYSYDSYGRLIEVYLINNQNKIILEQYDYQFTH